MKKKHITKNIAAKESLKHKRKRAIFLILNQKKERNIFYCNVF